VGPRTGFDNVEKILAHTGTRTPIPRSPSFVFCLSFRLSFPAVAFSLCRHGTHDGRKKASERDRGKIAVS
jgi:hypothetical protein